MKYLIVGPSWVGDMVMAQSLFKSIKNQDSQAIIDVLAPLWSLPVVSRMPEINEAIQMPVEHGKLGLITRYKLGKELRKNQYNRAIILPNSFKSALVPFLAKIPVRTGWLGEFRWGLLNDIRYLDKNEYPKMIERFLALNHPKCKNHKALNSTKDIIQQESHSFLPCLDIDQNNAKSALNRLQIKTNASPILAICPGSAYGVAKTWKSHHFAEVIAKKINNGWQVWIFGSQKDQTYIADILNLVKHYNDNRSKIINEQIQNLAGKINLLETIDLLALTDLIISNDSGLMHIAASVNKPVIAIYGSTTPKFTPPLSDRAVVLEKNLECRPCFKRTCPLKHHNCMENIKPDEVLYHIDKIYN